MTDKKFREKKQSLIEYEDSVYAEFLEWIKPFNEQLKDQNCEIFCCLMWEYNNGNEELETKDERVDFNRKDSYACDIILEFHLPGTNYYNCEEGGLGFQIFHTITKYDMSFFRGRCFSKCDTAKLKKEFHRLFTKVQSLGLEKATKEIRKIKT